MENQITVTSTQEPDNFQQEASRRVKAIQKELHAINKSMLGIAFNIHWIYENNGYKLDGFQNIYDFAKEKFGISRGTVSNYISVVDRFAQRINGQCTDKLAESYKGFKFSHLIAMVELTDEEIQQLSPEMSVREMQRKIKEMTAPALEDTEPESQPVEENVIDVEATEVNREVLFTFSTLSDYQNDTEKILKMIEEALKSSDRKIEISCVW